MDENIKEPTISVIMPVYNAAAYLKEAIESILGQTFKDFELIIINDGSTDNSSKVIESFKDERIRYLSQKNRGVSISRNKAIKLAVGEFIAMQDADDISAKDRFIGQINFLEGNPRVGLVGTNYHVIDENGKLATTTDVFTDPEDLKLAEIFSNQFGQGTVMIRKSYLKGLNYEENRKLAEDYDLWARLSHQTQIANLRKPLYSWRNAGTGASTNSENLEELDREQMAIRLREFKRFRENRGEYKLLSLHPLSTRGGVKKYLEMKNRLFRDMALLYCYIGLRRYAVFSLFVAWLWAPWVNKTYSQLLTIIFKKDAIKSIPYDYI